MSRSASGGRTGHGVAARMAAGRVENASETPQIRKTATDTTPQSPIAQKAVKRQKYGAVPTVVAGIRFQSKREAERYGILAALERAGRIRNLRLQVPFVLHAPSGAQIGKYVADFVYAAPSEAREWETVVEDSKGFRTPLYRWKKKHAEAEHGIRIREV